MRNLQSAVSIWLDGPVDGEDIASLSALMKDFEQELGIELCLEEPTRIRGRLSSSSVTYVDLRALLEGVRVLVTFNGRGFDLPLLRNRALVTRTFLDLDRPHLDLLPPCRRLFRPRTSNCRLVTLEREILGFARSRLGPALAPRALHFHHHLPRTPSGKIVRKDLRTPST